MTDKYIPKDGECVLEGFENIRMIAGKMVVHATGYQEAEMIAKQHLIKEHGLFPDYCSVQAAYLRDYSDTLFVYRVIYRILYERPWD